MKAKLLILLCCVLITFGASAQYTFPACNTPWAAGTYTQGNRVSHKSANWEAKYYTTAEPGSNGDWLLLGKCGDGGIGPDYTGPQKIVGYLPYWVPNFDYTTWDPGTVTHINIAFNLFKQNNNDYNSSNFASVAWGEFHNRKVDSILFDLGVLNRAKAKGTKVCVAIGGATDYAFLWLMERYYNNDAKLEEIANFITNYVNTKGIDGVDLDLECWWPDATISGTTEQGGRVRGDKWGGVDVGPHPAGVGLKLLAQKLRAKMPNKVLSAAVFGTSYYGNNYDDGVAQYLDYLGLMTYDFTGSWNTSPVGPHSSLYKIPAGTYQGQSDANPIYAAEDALEYWMGMAPPAWNHDGGFAVPKAKLCIGVPFYGYDLSTRKPNNANGFVALKWNEIVAAYPNAATSYDPLDTRQLGGYIGQNSKKIYYETPRGAGAKITYTKNFGHQGVIIWELTGDTPYNGGSSLLKAINDAAGIVVNPPPTVSITSPANNSTFSAGATITINASASDNGSVSKVEFYNGTTLLGTDTTSPYSFSWANVSAGTYNITAKATDNQNSAATSTAVTVIVGNAAPTAGITSPANGATFNAPASITIQATATDANGTITKVDFYSGTTLLGTDTSSPYSFNWTNVAAGSYSLTAVATDNGGATGTSAAVNVTVNGSNSAPTVSITAPANNATFTAPATINITANASDTAPGTVSSVAFYNGSTLLGTDTSSPYSFSWTAVAAGTYTITAQATDNQGAVGTSSAITVTVNGQGQSIPGTIQSESYSAMSGVQLENTTDTGAGQNVGWIDANDWMDYTVNVATAGQYTVSYRAASLSGGGSVQLRSGSTTLATTSIPSTGGWQTWTTVNSAAFNLVAGTQTIRVFAGAGGFNLNWMQFSSACASSIAITSPSNNATFAAPASVTINVTVTSCNSISKVDFYSGSTLLGTDTSSPYSYTWSNVAAGSYGITARATDTQSNVLTSSVVNITVNGSNPAPTATITAPTNNATFTAPATINITANASDTAPGTVSSVSFYNGTTLLGTDNTSPYSFTWTNVAAGTYSITARATDNQGAIGNSSAVSVTVNPASGGCSDKPQYVENGGYVAGSFVQNAGAWYECKPYPYTGWCNGAAWAYAPGTGAHWQDAWILKGSCTGRVDVSSDVLTEENNVDLDGVTISPNPGSQHAGYLTVNFSSVPRRINVQMKDVNGRNIVEQEFSDIKEKSVRVDLPSLTPGMYLIRVQHEGKSSLRKYIVY